MIKKFDKEKLTSMIMGALGLLSVIIFWQIVVSFTKVGKIFPGPYDVLTSFFKSLYTPIGKYTLIQHTSFSLFRVLVGFALSGLTGIVVGLAMGRSRVMNAIITPIFEMIRPIPGIAWIPLAILWFGIGEQTKYFIIFMGGFAHVVVTTCAGAKRTEPILIGAAKMLGASNRQLFTKIFLPSSIPYIFAGLQVSLSTSWMAVLAAEMVSANEGSGWIIIMGMESGKTVQIVVGMISIGLVGLILASIMRGVEKKLCSWTIRGQ